MLNDDDSQYIIYYEEGQLFIIPRIFRFLQYKKNWVHEPANWSPAVGKRHSVSSTILYVFVVPAAISFYSD